MARNTIRGSVVERSSRLDELRGRVAAPFGEGRGDFVTEVMRYGDGSITQQLTRAEHQDGDQVRPWPPVGPFGNVPAPDRPLHRRGGVSQAWQGRSALSTERIGDDVVAVGVRGYPAVHQLGAVVRAKRRTASGKLAMQLALGLGKGAWIREETLLRGLVIPPRPVGLSRRMLERAASTLLHLIVHGRIGGGA